MTVLAAESKSKIMSKGAKSGCACQRDFHGLMIETRDFSRFHLPMKRLLFALLVTCAPALAESQALFNGKDFTGWKGEGYTITDGVITCSPKGRFLQTEKEYSNYILDFEFKLPPGGNNGLGIHYPGSGDAAYTGMECQILDDTAKKYAKLEVGQYHGSLYKLAAAKRGFLMPVGKWNKKRITVNGPKITVELNGTVILEADLSELEKKHPKHQGVKRRSGHIAFCGHGDPVSFRKIFIKELPTTTAKIEDGFASLFNGTDFTGWKFPEGHTGHWIAKDGVIHYDGKSKAKIKDLWTEKSYSDFVLKIDWRWAGPAHAKRMRPVLDKATGGTKKDANGKAMMVKVDELDSGIYLRGNSKSQVNIWNWPCGSGEVYGYRTDGKLPQEVRAALVPKVNADKPIGEWNTFIITMKGDRLTVVLNGQTVIENAQLPGVPEAGELALQHHGSALEFKNISIKEL